MTDLANRLSVAEQRREGPGDARHVAARRPRDAATLLILDRSGGDVPRVLVGRRHARHVFMPGKFVFPGGRVDPGDARVRPLADYEEHVAARLLRRLPARHGVSRIRAFGIAAIRETYEEAGLLIGGPTTSAGAGRSRRGASSDETWSAFAARGLAPSLAPLRFVARAVTPPGQPRRFDARFFAVWSDAIAARLDGPGPSGELEEIQWMRLDDAADLDLPGVTRTVIADLSRRLVVDPDLNGPLPVPFYRWQRGVIRRDEI